MLKLAYPDNRPWHETAIQILDKFFLLKKDGWYLVDKPVYDRFLELMREGKTDKGYIYNNNRPIIKPINEWIVPSRSGGKEHTVKIDYSNNLVCNCNGYNFYKHCWACEKVRLDNGLTNLTIKEKLKK
jgi:hypothetical protein